MGTVTAQTLISRAAYLLEDTGNQTWTRVELLGWLNEAQSQVVALKPSANTVRQNLSMAAGTLQTLPVGSTVLLDIPRNVDGPSVRLVSREMLDAGPYDWHTAKAAATVKNYVYNNDDGNVFYVFPPNTGGGSVVAVYAKVPSTLTNESQPIRVEDGYQAAILNYMLYRAYSKDTDYAESGQMSLAFYGAFKDALSGKAAGDAEVNADHGLGSANPDNQGSLK